MRLPISPDNAVEDRPRVLVPISRLPRVSRRDLVQWRYGRQSATRLPPALVLADRSALARPLLSGCLDRAGIIEAANALAGPMRVQIVPMYLVWMLLTMVQVAIIGPLGLPGPFAAVVSGINFVAGFAPYVIADYVVDRWRHGGPQFR